MSEHSKDIKELAPVAFWRGRMRAIWAIMILMGPGLITSSVDNDAGGIATYSLAGSEFGFSILWTLVPITFVLIVIQEIGARMAVVTGKGLSDLIRERYGVKAAFYTMSLLIITNMGTSLANFAGIAAALEIFGISRYISIPICMMLLLWIVVKGTYGSVEKVFLTACVFYIAYIVAGILVDPDWGEVFTSMVNVQVSAERSYLVMLVALIGTTISPWMLFYLQASMVEKGLGLRDLKAARVDVVAGSIVVNLVAFFIILACAATLFKAGVTIETAEEAAMALAPLAGPYSKWLFAFGLFNASMFAASIIPLSTSYTVCEAFGWESSLDKKFPEAPQFYGLYCFMVINSGVFMLIPNLPLIPIMYISQVLNGLSLPIVLTFMFLLVNDRELMGDYRNGLILNIISWVTLLVLFALSFAMLGLTLKGQM